MMKQRFLTRWASLIALLVAALPVFAQNDEADEIVYEYNHAATHIYMEKGKVQSFFDFDIDSITFSCYDADFNFYDHPVMQYIYAKDTVYAIPLEQIDSIGLYSPEVEYHDDVVLIEGDLEFYYIDNDTISILFSSAIPEFKLPKVGQIIYSEEHEVAGRVTSIEKTAGGYRCWLDLDISMNDVFKRLIDIGNVRIDVMDDGSKVRRYQYTRRRAEASEGGENANHGLAYWLLHPTISGDASSATGMTLEWKKFDLCKDKKLKEHLYFSSKIAFKATFGYQIAWNIDFERKQQWKEEHPDKTPDDKDFEDILHFETFFKPVGSIEATFTLDNATHEESGKKRSSIPWLDPDDDEYILKGVERDIKCPYGISINFAWFRPYVEYELEASLTSSFSLGVGMKIGFDFNTETKEVKPGLDRETQDPKYVKFEFVHDFDFAIEGKLNLAVGNKPRIGLSWLNKKVTNISAYLKQGVYAEGKLKFAPFDLIYDRSERLDVYNIKTNQKTGEMYKNSWYDDALSPKTNGIRLGPLEGFGLECTLIGNHATLYDKTRDGEAWFTAGIAPLFKDFDFEYNAVSGVGKMTATAYGTSIKEYDLGFAYTTDGDQYFIEYAKDKDGKLVHHPNWSTKSTTYSVSLGGLRSGLHYQVYPVIRRSDGSEAACMASPAFDFNITPKMVIQSKDGRIADSGDTDITLRRCVFAGYDNADYLVGVAYIDAENVPGVTEKNVDFRKSDAVHFHMLNDQERRSLLESSDKAMAITVKGLTSGHHYLFTPFYSDGDDGDGNRYVNYGDNVVSVYTSGLGMRLDVESPIVESHQFTAKAFISWNPKVAIDHDKLKVSFYYRNLGDKEWKCDQLVNMINGHYFLHTVGGLKQGESFEYYYNIEYPGVSDNNYADRTSITTATSNLTTERTYTEYHGSVVKVLSAELTSRSSNTASFRVNAQWNTIDGTFQNDLARVGVLYVYKKSKPVDSRFRIGYSSSYKFIPATDFEVFKDGTISMEVELTKLNYEGYKAGTVYYMRPVFMLNNEYSDKVAEYILSDDVGEMNWLDEFDEIQFFGDGEYGVCTKYGEIQKFNTLGKGKGTVYLSGITPPIITDKGFVFKTVDGGAKSAKEIGVILSHTNASPTKSDKSAVTIPATQVRDDFNFAGAPAFKELLHRAPRRVDAFDDDDEDIDESLFTEIMLADDVSQLKANESYTYRSYYEDSDGSIIYSPLQKFEYKDGAFVPVDVDGLNPDVETFIDMGTSVLWMSGNLGAKSIEDYGNYYAWGEVESKAQYDMEHYTSPESSSIDGDISTDAVMYQKGTGFHIPTAAQWQELLDNCTSKWTTRSGVGGILLTSKTTKNTIFLPAAGNMYGTNTNAYSLGHGGCYWAADAAKETDEENNISPETDAIRLHFNDAGEQPHLEAGRKFYGRSIRPVHDK